MMRRILHEDIYSLSSYDYALPPENIAQFPASPRDSSRLLVWNAREHITDTSRHFRDITSFLRPDDLLILNDTRVIPARLLTGRGWGNVAVMSQWGCMAMAEQILAHYYPGTTLRMFK